MADHDVLKNFDPVQVAMMGERCILVDDTDKVVGHDTKKNCSITRYTTAGDLLLTFLT